MLAVKLLGQFAIRFDGQLIALTARRAQLLFAYLIMNAGVTQPREKVAGLLWPNTSDTNARLSLRQTLWQIRKALNALTDDSQFLFTDDISLTFLADANYWLDVDVIKGKVPTAASADELMGLVANYTGDLLPGYYEDWVVLEREHLQASCAQKMKQLLDLLIAAQRWEEVLEWGERWIALGHVPESAYRALMTAYHGLGDTAMLATTFQRCVDVLRRELDVEPSDQTWATYERLSQEKRPQAKAIGLLRDAAARADSGAQPAPPPHNLPPQPTRFVGRKTELQEIGRRVQDPACRLITLIGPGGVGKTRLALEVAANQIGKFSTGIYFVPLAGVTSGEALIMAIARSIGFAFYTTDHLASQLLNHLREKQLLLVLDNFEHLLNSVDLIEDILREASGVKLIVTSRQRLNLPWEWLHEVGGLDYPTDQHDEAAVDYSAVQLFMECARRADVALASKVEQQSSARVCQLVEGTPLGIELAAAWLRVLSCQEIVQRIESNLDSLVAAESNAPERQRSLRATFEYSWNLLADQQRTVFKQLAVFQGGFRREAAEAIAGAPVAALAELMNKSFVRRSVWGRYELHEIMRQYAIEKLHHSEDDLARNTYTRLAEHYLAYAQQHRHDYPELEQEWGNLNAGLQAAYEQQRWPMVLDYARTLTTAWFIRGRYTDARHGYRLACAAAQTQNDVPAIAECLYHWARACIEQSDYAEASRHLHRSWEICSQLDDRCGQANAQSALARIAIEEAHYREAQQLLADCLAIREQLSDQLGVADALHSQARAHYYLGDYQTAEALSQQALGLQQSLGDQRAALRSLRVLADIALHGTNDLSAAEKYCQQAQMMGEALEDQGELASVHYALAEIYRRRGDFDLARENASQGLTCFRLIGDRKSQAQALFRLSLSAADQQNYATAWQEAAESLALCRRLHDQVGTMYVLKQLGDISRRLERHEQSTELWTEALGIAEALQHPVASTLRERLGQSQRRL